MRLRWTPDAAEDLYRIVQYIQEDNPSAAAQVADILVNGCESLLRFPRAGRLGRRDGTRELVVVGLPYIVVYRIADQVVEVLRIYHGAQERP
jgi:toxin ParE1/3/4